MIGVVARDVDLELLAEGARAAHQEIVVAAQLAPFVLDAARTYPTVTIWMTVAADATTAG
jgi:hypothetical protein